MNNPDITKVVFRKYKSNGDIVALFPCELGTSSVYTCLSYETFGQHGNASPDYVASYSTPATPDEYKALYDELRGIGYTLKVATRISSRDIEVRRMKLGKMLPRTAEDHRIAQKDMVQA